MTNIKKKYKRKIMFLFLTVYVWRSPFSFFFCSSLLAISVHAGPVRASVVCLREPATRLCTNTWRQNDNSDDESPANVCITCTCVHVYECAIRGWNVFDVYARVHRISNAYRFRWERAVYGGHCAVLCWLADAPLCVDACCAHTKRLSAS